ncbi:hypothetical protein R3P38DRAFT_2816393 [Favolaschia claudopus]|uniref:Uncharacterized protein n=1 Tax=Favolaschia claudopus TaxID=2862362 RepID=A0AAV9YYY7_9AGAR
MPADTPERLPANTPSIDDWKQLRADISNPSVRWEIALSSIQRVLKLQDHVPQHLQCLLSLSADSVEPKLLREKAIELCTLVIDHRRSRVWVHENRGTETFSDWVVLCALKGEDAEVAPLRPWVLPWGTYSDFNLYVLAVNMSHPIFDWAIAVQQEHPPHNADTFAAPTASSGANADLQPPIILKSLPQPKKLVPPLHGLTEIQG